MKVCLLAAMACRAGGADVYTEELALGLVRRGHEVTLICQKASERVQQHCETHVAVLPDYDRWRAVWRLAPYFRWRFWQRFISELKLSTPDVAICSKSVCFGALARKFPATPLVYLPHWRIEPVEVATVLPERGSWLQGRLACGLAAQCERKALLRAATTVRFTAGNVADLRAHYGLPCSAPFNVIPAGVLGPKRVERKVRQGPIRLLALCRLVETKNLALLLQCLAELREAPPWRLDVVGDGPERMPLERLANEFQIGDRVIFRGHCEDPPTFLEQADLHVFPSRLESFGLVVLEAMAYGVPSLGILSDGTHYRNANHEIITSGVDGLIADNEADFRRQLAECLSNRERLHLLGQRARRTYLSRHQWDVVLDRWEELLGGLVGKEQREQHREIATKESVAAAAV
jgi:glycosyltransferase involved in cell wall biosynthesis